MKTRSILTAAMLMAFSTGAFAELTTAGGGAVSTLGGGAVGTQGTAPAAVAQAPAVVAKPKHSGAKKAAAKTSHKKAAAPAKAK
ncbi:MAG: hypothetical protein ACKVOE_06700 [Rickettsiales bacterium]